MSYAVMASAASIVCTMGATLASCYKELAAEPAVLMRPPAPKKKGGEYFWKESDLSGNV